MTRAGAGVLVVVVAADTDLIVIKPISNPALITAAIACRRIDFAKKVDLI
jgi:hypothetical protein